MEKNSKSSSKEFHKEIILGPNNKVFQIMHRIANQNRILTDILTNLIGDIKNIKIEDNVLTVKLSDEKLVRIKELSDEL